MNIITQLYSGDKRDQREPHSLPCLCEGWYDVLTFQCGGGGGGTYSLVDSAGQERRWWWWWLYNHAVLTVQPD